jgi:hypothetical protein
VSGGGVTDTDLGYREFMRAVSDIDASFIDVGVRGGGDVATYAAANEFGTADGHVPERSFLRSTLDEHREEYAEVVAKGLGRIIDGKSTPERELGRLGLRVVRDVQAKIVTSVPPPNAPSTIARKGSSTTLIDTGRLRQSIDFEINSLDTEEG